MARRIRLAMGKGEAALQKALTPSSADTAYSGMVGALAGKSAVEAKAMVEEVLNLAGIAPIGGRPVAHIAERFLAQAEMAKGLPAKVQDTLASYFDIAAPLPKAIEALEKLSAQAGLDLNGRMDSFRRRADLMASQNIAVDSVQFSTRFGRRMDYYTGMVFEIYDPSNKGAGHVVGGGRYDGLLNALGASGRVPAVGCSIWLDRVQGAGA
jgi:ATP phosphoribosyltransferase regulatory subunit